MPPSVVSHQSLKYLQLVAFPLDAHFSQLPHFPAIATYLRVLKIDHIHMNEPCLLHGIKVPTAQNALRQNSRFYNASQLP